MFRILIAITLISFNCGLTIDELLSRFARSGCIEGSLISTSNGQAYLYQEDTGLQVLESVVHTGYVEGSDLKSNTYENPLSLISELAQLNKITYYYYLKSESGPPHNKMFTVLLKLGKEEYEGIGSSIKLARSHAAQKGLKDTNYKIPETDSKLISDQLTPTAELNNLATKMGIKVTYELDEFGNSIDYMSIPEENRPRKSYITRLNNSIYHSQIKYHKINSTYTKKMVPPFTIIATVGDKSYSGIGHTIKDARHSAAEKALKNLKGISEDAIQQCFAEGEICNMNNLKSPISSVYEYATRNNIGIAFELVEEIGPDHKKEFVMKCQLGDLVTEGRGKSKKESKKMAAEEMLKKLDMIDPGSINKSTGKGKSTTGRKQKKKSKVIKSSVERIAQDVKDYVSDVINYFAPDDDIKRDEESKERKDNRNVDDDSSKTENYKRILLSLLQQKDISFQYTDVISTSSNRLSLLTVGIHPIHVCLGEGLSFDDAHEKASIEALKLLDNVGVNNMVPSEEILTKISIINIKELHLPNAATVESEAKE